MKRSRSPFSIARDACSTIALTGDAGYVNRRATGGIKYINGVNNVIGNDTCCQLSGLKIVVLGDVYRWHF